MSLARLEPERTTVNIGGATMKAAQAIQDDLNLPNVSITVRMSVVVLDAINTAEKMGFRFEMIDGRGKRYRYSLLHPKTITAIDADGMARGAVLSLVADNADTEEKKLVARRKAPRLKAIKGGKSGVSK